MDIYVTVLIIVLATTAAHYFPWRGLLGQEVPRLIGNAAAMVTVMIPASALLLLWNKMPPAYFQRVTVALILAVVWVCILAAGVTALVLTGLDSFLETRARMLTAEDEGKAFRSRMDGDGKDTEFKRDGS